ncbi:hypothetical protein [Plantactinospora sonchi]|uniref:Uncharacterized protein n=1 Tax=Plantactinospora sonchi TaxID=1544735 RepID=A0ABU7RSB9_9ACTN
MVIDSGRRRAGRSPWYALIVTTLVGTALVGLMLILPVSARLGEHEGKVGCGSVLRPRIDPRLYADGSRERIVRHCADARADRLNRTLWMLPALLLVVTSVAAVTAIRGRRRPLVADRPDDSRLTTSQPKGPGPVPGARFRWTHLPPDRGAGG